jgi:hypothetical protein
MSEPKDVLLIVEQLERSNRRWKRLALAACSVLVVLAIVGVLGVGLQRMRAEAQMRAANEALARAQMVLNQGQPK